MSGLSRRTVLLGGAAAAAPLGGCGNFIPRDGGTYRFRLTLAVMTPQGVRSAAGVIEIAYSMVLNFNGGGQMSREDVRGEAVFLDLGQGRNLVLLLLFDPYLPTQALFGRAGFNAVETLLQGRKLEGSVELRPDLIPTLVSFSDLNDPASARVVPPSDAGFASAFGPGFRLAGVTLEMVPAGVWPFNLVGLSGTPVTRGIEGKMPTMLAKLRELDKTLQLVHPNDPLKVRSGHLSVK